jgi:hypothetical protein
MSFLAKLLRRLQPPTIDDPTFGRLLFMRIGRAPSRSYWEGEWLFPPTGTRVAIGLPGGEDGPSPEARVFYEALPERFDWIIESARPGLDDVFQHWLERPISDELWDDVKLSGLGVEDPTATPLEWDVMFETIGKKWLGISVPFIDDAPQRPVVDT